MTWGRFGYICRKASVDCKEDEPVSACLERIEGEYEGNLYGSKILAHTWPRKILDAIGQMPCRHDALFALNTYMDLRLARPYEAPMRFRRVIAYLGLVTFVFYMVMSIYQLFVAPSFLAAFDNLGLPMPAYLMGYQDYWVFLVLVISVLLISSLVIGYQLKQLFVFKLGAENTPVIKYLVFPGIRQSYLRVVEILSFPINTSTDVKDGGLITSHLTSLKNSNMSLSLAMQELLEVELFSLMQQCERQMKLLTILFALFVIASVFLFLSGLYTPIFVMGEIS